MAKLYFIDFDRTLFNNHEFFQDFSTTLAAYFEIDGEELHKIAERHNEIRKSARGIFSAFSTMREEYPHINVEDVKRIAKQELSDRSYVFADVKRTLQALEGADHEVRVITVGTDEYQHFKLGFAPILESYPFTVTQDTKGKSLLQFAHEFKNYEEVILVDDRGDTFDEDFFDLGITGVRLNRVDSTYADKPTPAGITEITTLVELLP